MTGKQGPTKAELRRRAEERLREQSSSRGGPRADADGARLVHELQVHQVELEMQNEELQQAHATAEALRAQYTDLYDFAPTGYATLDRDGKILRLNLEAARMVGVERTRLVDRRLHLYLGEGDRRVFLGFLERVFAGGGREWCEVEFVREEQPPLFARISCVASADGQTCRAALSDITERRQAEAQAQARRDQLLRILDAVPDGAYVVGQDHELQYVNPALLARGGPVDGRKCFNYFHGRTEPCPDCANPQAFAGAATRREYRTARGIVYEVQDVPVTGSDGLPARLVFLHDITGLRRAEEKVRAAQAETQRLLAQSERSRLALLSTVEDERVTAAALRQSEERLRLKLDSVLDPDANIEEQELANILDVPALQSLMDDLQKVTGVGIGIRDLEGNELVNTKWQDICTKFHRANPRTFENCLKSDRLYAQGLGPGEHRAYRCLNGLWDSVAPIFVGGKQVGNVYFGQFFYEDDVPDRAVFVAQAEKYGFDKEAYLAAFDRAPRWSRKRAESLARFHSDFAALVSRLSYGNLKLAMTLMGRQRAEEELRQRTEDIAFINRLNVAANRGAGLAELQEQVSRDLGAMFGLRNSVFYALTSDRRWLVPQEPAGAEPVGPRVDLSVASPYAEVLEGRSPRLFTETADLIRLVQALSVQPHVRRLAPEHVKALGEYSVLLTPLAADKEQFGLIELVKPGRFSEHDVERLRVLGTQLDGILDRRLKDEQLAMYGKYLERMVEERTAELEATQQSLVRNEKLATLGRVAGSVAHELRNPLGAIRNASYFLQETATDKLDGKQLRHLQLIDEYIERANKAITAILDFTQGRPTQRKACAVRPILERAIVDAALPGGVDIRLKRSTALPHVLVDDEQMVVVFRNLLTNAGQAMEGHGMVRVAASLRGGFVDVTVADSGAGIAPENMARLFQPLFTTRDIGVGLGLAICRAFVEGCGGSIEVESEVGKGTTFTVSLPVAPECPRAAAVAPD